MTKIHLEFLVDVEGDDSDLKKIKSKLLETHSSLEEAITGAIQEKIETVDIDNEVKVKLPPSRVALRGVLEGGLNAQEWLEKGDIPASSGKKESSKGSYQD